MRISCPHCGDRDRREFTILGDADPVRPDGMDDDAGAMLEYVYQRTNPAGLLREYWYHGAGCHAWLVVERDTRTHAVTGVVTARQAAIERGRGGR
ncbi:MAG: sarcosine oxidase subunit delta [Pseudorhodoplanes sp.]|uniref:sarcosine oxidase subunit delta n=1 Tax=Pseudorhodoplanes sp. TaxID=1934341 RepID=UPI003D0E8219